MRGNGKLGSLEAAMAPALTLMVGVAMAMALALSAVDSAPGQDHRSPGVVEASRVVIRDERGTVRIMLWVRPTGEAAITLFNAQGQGKMNVSVGPDGMPAIGLLGKEKDQFVMIQAMKDGSAGVRVNGKRGLSMVAGAEGQAGLIVQDGSETLEAWGVDREGKSLVEESMVTPTDPRPAGGQTRPGGGRPR